MESLNFPEFNTVVENERIVGKQIISRSLQERIESAVILCLKTFSGAVLLSLFLSIKFITKIQQTTLLGSVFFLFACLFPGVRASILKKIELFFKR